MFWGICYEPKKPLATYYKILASMLENNLHGLGVELTADGYVELYIYTCFTSKSMKRMIIPDEMVEAIKNYRKVRIYVL